ncbi:LL-diaminopimelate aminotransferase, partial [Candidatus Aerophobetes bacterium]
EKIKNIYRKRRDLFVEGLRKLGWKVNMPLATFYLWIRIPGGKSSIEFTQYLLEECGIMVTPGVGFGPSGEGYIRIALTVNEEKLKEALNRLEKIRVK